MPPIQSDELPTALPPHGVGGPSPSITMRGRVSANFTTLCNERWMAEGVAAMNTHERAARCHHNAPEAWARVRTAGRQT
jgi:hypothetical protein